ncbi:hypothetical protein QQZ08_004819 [Neonectria magnoliae]|uniref:N-acetyltransferase domain-containing protein n=1 Tax=Neonectria magnoliae TaxID=2732573 RepID=A0ABR1I588_9HYPO
MATQAQIEVGLHRKGLLVFQQSRTNAAWAQTIQKAVDITVPAFYNDPLFAWMFLEARDWGSVMAVSEPGQKYDGVRTVWRSDGVSATLFGGLMPTIRLLFEYLGAVDKVKAKVITGSNLRDCFYILITATEPQSRKQGLLSAMTTRLLDEARKLEATTKYSTQQFTRFGFETIDEITVGKNSVNAQGVKQAGGDGVTVTGMIWWPEGAKEK